MISKIPSVLTNNKMINHHLLESRAAFHKAKPFQISDHTTNTTNIHGATLIHEDACGCASRFVINVSMTLFYQGFCYMTILLYTSIYEISWPRLWVETGWRGRV